MCVFVIQTRLPAEELAPRTGAVFIKLLIDKAERLHIFQPRHEAH